MEEISRRSERLSPARGGGETVYSSILPQNFRKLINNHFMHGNASLSPMWQQTNAHLPNLVHLHLSQVKAFCSLHEHEGEHPYNQPTIGANQIHSLPARNLFLEGMRPFLDRKSNRTASSSSKARKRRRRHNRYNQRFRPLFRIYLRLITKRRII